MTVQLAKRKAISIAIRAFSILRLLPDTISSGFCFTGSLPISPYASVFYSFPLPHLEMFPLGFYSSTRTDNSPLSRSAWSLCRLRQGGTHHLWRTWSNPKPQLREKNEDAKKRRSQTGQQNNRQATSHTVLIIIHTKHVCKCLPVKIQENNQMYFYIISFKQKVRNNKFGIIILHLRISCN
jgi:hypothetical protein